ncbi:unnamed protein product [Fraxinus pennsylvanica]|uniref:Uncharacterized protein n=1 Tax=Fraxinus pennsylvanica TaxID=56036 RepID=A0AAD2DMQ7_9LAMI|nr:unnamed protein product [Fraxinus pennsylvanica]
MDNSISIYVLANDPKIVLYQRNKKLVKYSSILFSVKVDIVFSVLREECIKSALQNILSERMLNGPPNAKTSYKLVLIPLFRPGEKMICMLTCPGVGAEGFTPVLIYPKKAAFIDYGKCICSRNSSPVLSGP